ncbi:MAG: fluoride efflux transporter CrcB [Thiohalomonadaceae bacterium]
MKQLLLVGLGGAFGSMLRFGLSTGLHALLGRAFPWGTLFVNVTGSFAIGLLYVLLIERVALGPEWRALLMVGLLGGYTTFSSFSIETLNLVESGDVLRAAVNVLASVVLCLAAAWVGVSVARQV